MRWAYSPPPAWMLVTWLPAAVGVGGEVADGVEQAGAVLAVDAVHRCACTCATRWPISGFSRSAIDGAVTIGAAGDVVEVAHHQVVAGRAGVLAGVGVQLVGEGGAERRRPRQWAIAASSTARTTVAWMIISEIFSLMCACAGEAVGLGDELGQADQHVGAVGHRRSARRGAPTARASGRTPRRWPPRRRGRSARWARTRRRRSRSPRA